jgi:hypothetical protein
MQRWLKEPLFHFLIIGAGLFFIFNVFNKSADQADRHIVVSQAEINRLASFWEKRWFRRWQG